MENVFSLETDRFYQEILPDQERKVFASISAQGFRKALEIRSTFNNGCEPCFKPLFHHALIHSVEDFLIEACKSKSLHSEVIYSRSKNANRYPYVEYLSATGLQWHFKYCRQKRALAPQSSYRKERALFNDGLNLFFDFDTNTDGSTFYKLNSGKIFGILELGYFDSEPTFLQVVFPDTEYKRSVATLDLTSYLKKEFRSSEEHEEFISEQKTVTGLKKIARTGA